MKLDFTKPFVQVAGISDLEEAYMLTDSGVNYIGFPLCLDYHKPDMSESGVKDIISKTKGGICPVLITYLDKAKDISNLCDFLNVQIVQLHGNIEINEISKLKKRRPDLDIIKSLVVRSNNIDDLLSSMIEYNSFVDSYITDTYDPDTGASGATGKMHNWEISRQIVMKSSKPVILAGGMNPENVSDAIRKVQPAGVDVHTGVEDSSGRKEIQLVRRFICEAKKGFSFVTNNKHN